MSNWRSRLVVSVDGLPVTPVDSFNSIVNTSTEALHSLEATHVGYVVSPMAFTFTLAVKAIGPSAALLTRLALDGTEFSIDLQEAAGAGGDWSFKKQLFNRCVITSASPSNATIQGAPAATYNGVSLEFTVEDAGAKVTVP